MSIEINITENIVEVTPTEQQVDINITENPIEVNVTDEIVLIQQTGLPGPQGIPGPGVPIGGNAGQILAKNSSTNYDTLWINNAVGTVTSIATTAPITGGTITTSGTIGITQASASGDGYLSSTDWNTFNNKQNVLTNPITGTGTVNYVPKFTGASALADSNIQDSGSLITLGTAVQATSTSIFNNSMALGTALQANSLFFLSKALGGNTFANGISIGSSVSSAVTGLARYFNASTSTDAGFTLSELINYNARQGTFLSPVVDQIGFNVESTMSGATNNYAFRGNINSAANSWNFYANGTALNFMRGALLVGSSVDDTINKLQITGSAIVSSSITANSFIKSGGTSSQILAADGSVITAGTNITISGGTISSAASGGTVTSVGLTMPAAFAVANSPITSAGTLAVTAIGTSSQYIRGDGSLATIPSTSSGGSSVNYYLNGSVAASVAGYQQMANSAIIGTGTDFTLVGNGLIAQFLTDVANPNRILIPGGAWNFEMYFNVSSSGGNTKFYVELLKYDGTTFTSIASSSAVAEEITGGTTVDLYVTSLAVPETVLLTTDRLAVRVYIVDNSGGRTVTLHTEDNTLCEIITTFAGGIAALNGLTANTQYFATGTSGTDFNILSATDTHTFNLPTASAANRGALSSADWTTFNSKIGGSGTTNYLPKFTGTSAIGNSLVFDNGTNVGISTTSPLAKLHVSGVVLSDFSNFGFYTAKNNNHLTQNAYFDGAWKSYGSSATFGSAILFQTAGQSNTALEVLVDNSISAANEALTFVSLLKIFTSGNFSLGNIVDSGFKFDVSGTARVQTSILVGTSGNAIPNATQVARFVSNTTGSDVEINGNGYARLFFNDYSRGTDLKYYEMLNLSSDFKISRLNDANNLRTERLTIFGSTGNVFIGSSPSDATAAKLFVNGTGRYADNLTVSKNQNAGTTITVSNTTSGTSAGVYIGLTSDATSGSSSFGKYSTTNNATKIISATDAYIYNGATAGDIAILNDFATGKIKFAAGGASTAQMTLTSAGRLLLGTTTDNGTDQLQVTGTIRTTSTANIGGSLNVTGVTTLSDIAAIGTAVTQNNLNINRAITGAVTANGVQVSSQVGGTVTTAARYFSAIASTAAGTLTDLFNFRAAQGTFTGTVTNQYGYFVDATLIGATNNYGFRGSIPAAANRWNLYMDGTAINYLNGDVLIGTTTPVSSAKVVISSTTQGFLPPRMTTTEKNAISTPAAGLIVYDTTLGSTSVYDGSTWINDTITTNRQAASYSLVLTDRGKLVEMNVATANNLTVPLNSSIAFPIGTKIDLSQYGAGQTTVVATGGVTIRSAGGALKLALQYSGASLVKIATDEWYLFGDITV